MNRTLSPTVEIAEQDLIDVALRSPALTRKQLTPARRKLLGRYADGA